MKNNLNFSSKLHFLTKHVNPVKSAVHNLLCVIHPHILLTSNIYVYFGKVWLHAGKIGAIFFCCVEICNSKNFDFAQYFNMLWDLVKKAPRRMHGYTMECSRSIDLSELALCKFQLKLTYIQVCCRLSHAFTQRVMCCHDAPYFKTIIPMDKHCVITLHCHATARRLSTSLAWFHKVFAIDTIRSSQQHLCHTYIFQTGLSCLFPLSTQQILNWTSHLAYLAANDRWIGQVALPAFWRMHILPGGTAVVCLRQQLLLEKCMIGPPLPFVHKHSSSIAQHSHIKQGMAWQSGCEDDIGSLTFLHGSDALRHQIHSMHNVAFEPKQTR